MNPPEVSGKLALGPSNIGSAVLHCCSHTVTGEEGGDHGREGRNGNFFHNPNNFY